MDLLLTLVVMMIQALLSDGRYMSLFCPRLPGPSGAANTIDACPLPHLLASRLPTLLSTPSPSSFLAPPHAPRFNIATSWDSTLPFSQPTLRALVISYDLMALNTTYTAQLGLQPAHL